MVLDAAVFKNIVGVFQKELEHRMYLQDLNITMEDLRMTHIVGRGTFGVVKLVFHHQDESKIYALKCLSKRDVAMHHQQKATSMEREINAQCYHPCIVQFIKTFQDAQNVYFLTEFLGGGDLFFAIREIGDLTKAQAQYYSGSVVLAVEYLHARGIMYRDLKPENVLLDMEGKAKLVDFGCCIVAHWTNTLVGTPEYLAPEVILGKGYTSAVDWWALGVMMHEFIVGPLPFGSSSDDKVQLFKEILEAPLKISRGVSDDTAVSVLSGLLDRRPEFRCGARGSKEIKEHVYFHGFLWNHLVTRSLPPPWRPDEHRVKESWVKAESIVENEKGRRISFTGKQGTCSDWCSDF